MIAVLFSFRLAKLRVSAFMIVSLFFIIIFFTIVKLHCAMVRRVERNQSDCKRSATGSEKENRIANRFPQRGGLRSVPNILTEGSCDTSHLICFCTFFSHTEQIFLEVTVSFNQ